MFPRKIRDTSIVHKLTLAYIVFIFLPSVFISGYSYYQFRINDMNEIAQNGRIYVNQIQHMINSKCDVVESISNNIAYNIRLHNFLKEHFSMNSDSYTEYSEYIYPLVNYAMIFQKINIFKIKVFINNETIPEGWDIFFHEKRIIDNGWYKEFIKSDSATKWVGPHSVNYFIYLPSEEKRPVMTYVEKIRSADGKYLGTIAIDIICTDLFSFMDDIYKQSEAICILDNKDKPVYMNGTVWNNKGWMDQWKSAVIKDGNEGHFVYKENMYTYQSMKPLGITIFKAVPVMSMINVFRNVTWTIGLLTVVNALLIVIFYIVLRYVFIKIAKNIKTVNDIISNNFIGKLPEDRKDEIGQIARQFNKLISRVNELVQDVVKKETAQRDAQLKALQFQINPHFIYNTIDIFRAKLEIEGNYEVADSMAYFGKMLRYNIETKSMYTTLESEVKYAMQYVSIHKLRYGDRLEVSTDLPEQISKHIVIKFVLQPIIENSITHGFKGRDCKNVIKISCEVRDGRIWIAVLDNGIGLNRRELERINYQLKYSKYDENSMERGDSIGLCNINERLRLFYGNEFYLQITRTPDEYTKTFFSIPFKDQTMEGQEHNCD